MSSKMPPARSPEMNTLGPSLVRKLHRTWLGTKTGTFLLLVILGLLGSSANPRPQSQNGQDVLTNSDVAKMVQAHLSVEIILAQIKSHPGNYSLSTDNLIKLKQLGVPDKVISAMQLKNAGPASAGSANSPGVTQSVNQPPNSSNPPTGSGDPNGGSYPSGSGRTSAGGAPSGRPATPPGTFPTLDTAADIKLGNERILQLNFMRLIPNALSDEALFRYFIMLNNCDNSAIIAQFNSELDYPQIAAFYKQKAAEILAGVPSEIKQTTLVTVGQYDPARGTFAIRSIGKGDLSVGYGCAVSGLTFGYSQGSPVFPRRRGGRINLTLTVNERSRLSEIAMPESEARRVIAQTDSNGNRTVYFESVVQIVQSQPKLTFNYTGYLDAEFQGQVREIRVTDNNPRFPHRTYVTLDSNGHVVAPGAPGSPAPTAVNIPEKPLAPPVSNSTASAKSATPAVEAPPFNLGRLDADAYSKLPASAIACLTFMRLTPHALDDDAILQNFIWLNNIGNDVVGGHLGNEFDRQQVLSYYKSHGGEILAGLPTAVISGHTAVGLGDYDMTRKAFPAHGASVDAIKIDVTHLLLGGITKLSRASPIVGPRYPGGFFDLAAAFPPVTIDWVPVSEDAARHYVESAGPNRTLDVEIKVELLQQKPFFPLNANGTISFPSKVVSIQLFDRLRDASGKKGHLFATLLADSNSGGEQPAVNNAAHSPDDAISSTEASDAAQKAAAFYYKKQYQDAMPLSERACASGNQDGCALEGLLYAFGLGVRADPARGKDLMTKSCEAGNSTGCDVLGLAYGSGVSVSKDKNKAFELFSNSCKGGFYDGCANLGTCYLYGIGVQQDSGKALENFDRACTLGHEQLTTACEGGYASACKNLARCYSRGVAVQQDPAKAKELLNQACKMGDRAACSEALNLK
jgi:uncharacterized protein